MSTAFATLAAAAAEQIEYKPLSARSILVTLAVIAVVAGAVVLAGLGYFSNEDD